MRNEWHSVPLDGPLAHHAQLAGVPPVVRQQASVRARQTAYGYVVPNPSHTHCGVDRPGRQAHPVELLIQRMRHPLA